MDTTTDANSANSDSNSDSNKQPAAEAGQHTGRPMLDVTDPNSRLSMQAVAERCGVHITTVYEWANAYDGSGQPKSRYLETAKVGGRRYTTIAALAHFVEQGPPDAGRAAVAAVAPPVSRAPTAEQISRTEKSRRNLARYGIEVPPLPGAGGVPTVQ